MSSCQWGTVRHRHFISVKFGFFVCIWEEQSSRFIKEPSVKRTGQFALRSVDSDAAQVCLPFLILHLFPLGMDGFDFALG